MEKNMFEEFTDETEKHGKYHSGDCEHAHSPRCRCWCQGKYHGAKTGQLAVIEGQIINRDMDLVKGEQVMTVDMGGQVGEAVKKFSTKHFRCLGICGKEIAASPVIGRPHDGGHPDKAGIRWWLFVACVYCGYQTALHKITRREVNVPIN